jgi:hypothetical protein
VPFEGAGSRVIWSRLAKYADEFRAFRQCADGEASAALEEERCAQVFEAAFKRNAKLRCYYELGREFAGMDAGAVWEDFRIGLGHLSGWKRVAVVTDVDWMRRAINVFRCLVPGEIRVFSTSEAAEARRVVAGLR